MCKVANILFVRADSPTTHHLARPAQEYEYHVFASPVASIPPPKNVPMENKSDNRFSVNGSRGCAHDQQQYQTGRRHRRRRRSKPARFLFRPRQKRNRRPRVVASAHPIDRIRPLEPPVNVHVLDDDIAFLQQHLRRSSTNAEIASL